MQSQKLSPLSRGQYVRLSNPLNEPFTAFVAIASQTEPQSVGVIFQERTIRMSRDRGLAITAFLPLTISVEAETVEDLYGNDWYVEVEDRP